MSLDDMGPPGDKGGVVYCIYLLLGTAILFPWNALITAADYYESKYAGSHTDRLITVCYLPVTLIMLLLMIHYHRRTNFALRILLGLAGFVCAMIAVPLLDAAATQESALSAVLLFTAFVGVCDGIAQGAIFGNVALLPPVYTQAVVTGTALSGVVVSLLRVVTKAALPDTPAGLRASADIYFAVSALVCAASFLIYAFLLPKLPFVQYYQKRRVQPQLEGGRELSLNPEQSDSFDKPNFETQWQPSSTSHHQAMQEGENLLLADRASSSLEAADQALPAHVDASQAFDYLQTAKAIWQPALSVLLVYSITLAIFPGFLAEDVSSEQLGSWYPVLLITAFNVADTAGKVIPVQPQLALTNRQSVLYLCIARSLFLPAFYVASQGAGPAVMGLLTLLLGLTNGYLTAVAMMLAPQGLKAQQAQMSGNIMVFFLVTGLSLGAAAGFLWLL